MEGKKQIQIPRPKVRQLEVEIQGITPLLTHRISEEVIEGLEAKYIGKAQASGNKGHKIKDIQQTYEASKYIVDGKDCFPCIAFKKAIMEAGKQQKMGSALRRSVIITGEYVELKSDPPVCDRRAVRVQRQMMLAYRAKYRNWSTTLTILYEEDSITNEQVLTFLSKAGQVVGVGDFRPECDGNFGRFTIKEVKESYL